jgi:hypothetical protein
VDHSLVGQHLLIFSDRRYPTDSLFHLLQAVKLDIDHAELELAILKEIHADKDAFYMISELFFEMHYDSIPMSPWFHHPNQTYLATLEYMTGLRNDGIRIHYWP